MTTSSPLDVWVKLIRRRTIIVFQWGSRQLHQEFRLDLLGNPMIRPAWFRTYIVRSQLKKLHHVQLKNGHYNFRRGFHATAFIQTTGQENGRNGAPVLQIMPDRQRSNFFPSRNQFMITTTSPSKTVCSPNDKKASPMTNITPEIHRHYQPSLKSIQQSQPKTRASQLLSYSCSRNTFLCNMVRR